MYEWLGICLALSALLTLNAAVSLLAATFWRLLQTKAQHWPAHTQAQWLFALRVIPGLTALVCVSALLIPAYIAHEPRHTAEEVTLKMAVLAAISAAGLLLALWRGLAAWRVTSKLIKNWIANSEPLSPGELIAGVSVPIPAYRLNHPFPVIAVVGTFWPKLFVADHLFESLTSEELSAAIAHECGHLTARDNLKRSLLRICRDVLTIVPCGRLLDRKWAEASEAAADEFAAQQGQGPALDLASALVKIARMVPAGFRPVMPVQTMGALLIGDNSGGIADRVVRLTKLASKTGSRVDSNRVIAQAIPNSLWLSFGTLLVAVAATATSSLATVHALIEVIVSMLQ